MNSNPQTPPDDPMRRPNAVDDVREIREQMSRACGNDVGKLAEHVEALAAETLRLRRAAGKTRKLRGSRIAQSAKMIDLVEKNLPQIATLCRKHGVRNLELFGSAAQGQFDAATSDIDFFYEFDSNLDRLADRYFGLSEELQEVLGCAVDLVSAVDAHNPFFLHVANRQRVSVYAA